MFLSPRLKVGSTSEEDAKDRGEIIHQGMKDLFGKNLVPKFCSSTAKLTKGLQYSEGQHVTINAHNQVAQYPVKYNDAQQVMELSHHECDKSNKMANAGEPVFVLWSEHITGWMNCQSIQETYVHGTYPRWKFVKESRVKAIIHVTTEIVELSEEQRKIKTLALRGFVPDPMDPKAAKIEERHKKACQKGLNAAHKSTLPVVAKGPSSSNELKRKSGGNPNPKPAKTLKGNSTTPEAKEERGQLNELKQKLRDTELELKTAQDRIKRLEKKENHMKKSYDDLKKKSDEELDGYGDLRSLKLATFNHFLTKWDNANEEKAKNEISELKNALPLTLRRYFSKEIEKEKDSLKH